MTAQRTERALWHLLRRAAGFAGSPRAWLDVVRRNLLLKILSVLAAFSLWLFVNAGARDTEVALQAPVRVLNIPSHLMIVGPRVDFIDVRVSGPRTILGGIERDRLAIPLDLRGVRPGPAVFRVGPDSLDLPRGVRVSLINPSRVTLELERIGRKVVPVRVELDGEVPDGLKVAVTKVEPPSVEVEGPAPEVKAVSFVQAERVPLSASAPGSQELDVQLENPGEYITLKPARISVGLSFTDEIVTRDVEVPVELRNAPPGSEIEPAALGLTLRGPKRLLPSLDPATLAVYVDATGKEPGDHEVPPVVETPAGIDLAAQKVDTLHLHVPGPGGATPQEGTKARIGTTPE